MCIATALCAAVGPVQAAQQAHVQEKGGQIHFNYAWLDHKNQKQNLSFALPAQAVKRGMTEFKPLDFNKAEAYAMGEVKKYLNKRSNGRRQIRLVGHQLSYNGFTSRQVSEEQKKIENVRNKAYDAYTSSLFYDYYDTPQGQTYLPDYRRLAKRYVQATHPIANAIKRKTRNMNTRQKVNYVLGFLQSIPYDTLQNRYTSNGAGFQTPYGLLVHNKGDCDTKSVAAAALLRNLFPNLRIVLVHVPGHAFVGLGFSPHRTDLSLKLGGSPFVLAEPVGPALVNLGEVSPESKRYLQNGQYSYQEVPF